MNDKIQTISSYDKNASKYTNKFNQIGARISDIQKAFSFFNVKPEKLKVVELGCANGRDAKEILKYTKNYLGIDASKKLIEIAKKDLPKASFEIADLETFDFPLHTNIIFAFASLLHSDKKALQILFKKAYKSLSDGGIFYISLKYAHYHKQLKNDEFGIRTFYYYTPEEIRKLASRYKVIYKDIHKIRNQNWFTIVLKKTVSPNEQYKSSPYA
jgi:SAM-dependent methyltransferase